MTTQQLRYDLFRYAAFAPVVLVILSQSKSADPGVRLTVLYREAKAGKRLPNSAQAVNALDTRPITSFRCDQVVVCDVVAGST